MAEPPRLSEITLPDEKSIIYFVTLCVKDRRKVLANARVFGAIKTAIEQLRRWNMLAAVIMPDHAHFIVGPREERGWEWQRGCFDHLLRSDENLESKWIYVQDNPVRHGLVQKAEAWPYYLDFVNDPGKLAASPTETQHT